MTVVYMNTDDIYQLFLNFDVAGVRKDAGRLWKAQKLAAAGDGTLAPMTLQPIAHQGAEILVKTVKRTYEHKRAMHQFTFACYQAGDVAETIGIDTTKIDNFIPSTLVMKIIDGPEQFPDFIGLWDAGEVVMAFGGANVFANKANAKRSIISTSSDHYKSRKELLWPYDNVS